jgi:DNA-directed RNA polymerase specialized sigma24 family protein
MSVRDPMEELADLILYNMDDWWTEIAAMEPRVGGSHVRLPVVKGIVGNIVESFVIRKDTALRCLRPVRAVIRRLPGYLRLIYRLRYREGQTRQEVADKARIELRTVDRRLWVIRHRVAHQLRRMTTDDLLELMTLARRLKGSVGDLP